MENSMEVIKNHAIKSLDKINNIGIQMSPYDSDSETSLKVLSFWRAEQFKNGKHKDIIIELNDNNYNAHITRQNTKQQKGNNLRLIWTNGGLYKEISKKFSNIYHIMCFTKTESGIRYKLEIVSDDEMRQKLSAINT